MAIDKVCAVAARNYLTRKGYNIIEASGNVILAECEECFVLAAVTVETEESFPMAEPPARAEYEMVMIQFLSEGLIPANSAIRLDHISIMPCCENQSAIIRHHIGAF